MDTAQIAPTTVILAADEASLYLQATTKVVWHPRGQTPIIKLHPGREFTYFYGALASGQSIQQILAEHPRLEIVHLPPAAPDLNPQEHVWKAARTFVSHNHRFAKLDQLAYAFERHLV
jgi:hypothetical protein